MVDDKDKFIPKPEDILTGKDLALNEKDIKVPVSDAEVRRVVKAFVPVLYKGMDVSETFNNVSIGDKYSQATPMEEEEIRLWDAIFGIRKSIYEKYNNGELYVPEISAKDKRLLASSDNIETEHSQSKQIIVEGGSDKKFRVNLDQTVETPIQPFDPKGMRYFISAKANLSGYTAKKGELYNAFMSIDIYVQDRYGR